MSTSPSLVVADRYRLVAPLGQGGMGRVWRATDVVLHRDVAIKELVPPPGLTPEERQEMRERSLREARAIARLNNMNVVRIFDVLRTDADPWIVMEYVPSRSLQDALAVDGPYAPVRAAEIGLGVLNALRAAHRAGVVHRDVKPGNVLIGEDGRVVLTDFGLATVPGDPNVTRTGLVLGSPAYIAPERARDGTAGPSADLWSLGATLYAAVEGSSPFARPSAIATLAALATENPPPARNAGPLKPVLNGLLRKDPSHRINADEAERLLLRATGRRSKLSLPMSPTMRRPGVGRERPALPGTPPIVPGSRAAAGSAPVVPGPRPPVTPARPGFTPPATGTPPGRVPVSPAGPGGRPPVYVPGKASVGRPAQPAENPTRVDVPKVEAPRLDATRLDTPPVHERERPSADRDQPDSGAAAPNPSGPAASGPAGTGTTPAQGPPGQGALAKGTRGVFGTISAAEIAAHRQQVKQDASDKMAEQAAVEQAAERAAAERAEAVRVEAERVEAERVEAERAEAERAEAERAEAERAEAARVEAVRVEAARVEAARVEAARVEAARVEAARVEAARVEAERVEAARVEAERVEAERAEAERVQAAEADRAATPPADGGKDVARAADAVRTPAQQADRGPVEDVAEESTAAEEKPATTAKPPAGARAGAGRSTKASRKRGRGRAAGTAGAKSQTGDAPTGTPSAAGPAAKTPASDSAPADAPGTGSAVGDSAVGGSAVTGSAVTGSAVGDSAVGDSAVTGSAVTGSAVGDSAVGDSAVTGSAVTGSAVTGSAVGDSAVSDSAVADAPSSDSTADAYTADGAQTPVDAEVQPPGSSTGAHMTSESTEPQDSGTATAEDPAPGQGDTAVADSVDEPVGGQADTGATVIELAKRRPTKETTATVAAARSDDRKVTTASLASSNAGGSLASIEDVAAAPASTAGMGTAASDTGGGIDTGSPPTTLGFNSSSRPAWTPMPVEPRPSGRGVTVLGTTLTRRQTVIGAAILAAIVLAVVLIVSLSSNGRDDQGSAKAKQPPVAAGGTTAPATPAQKPTTAASSAPATSAPATSVPSSTAPADTAGAVTLPAGWTLWHDQTGFTVPIPTGATITRPGTEVYFRKDNRLLIVDQTDQPKPDPVADWKNQEAARSGRVYKDYQRIKIVPVDYWTKAADWEFTYTTSGGNPQRAVKRGVITGPKRAYGISWYTSPKDWDASLPYLKLIYQGFQPAR